MAATLAGMLEHDNTNDRYRLYIAPSLDPAHSCNLSEWGAYYEFNDADVQARYDVTTKWPGLASRKHIRIYLNAGTTLSGLTQGTNSLASPAGAYACGKITYAFIDETAAGGPVPSPDVPPFRLATLGPECGSVNSICACPEGPIKP
jgi:hypothetical protein